MRVLPNSPDSLIYTGKLNPADTTLTDSIDSWPGYADVPLITRIPPAGNDDIGAVHATVDFNGADSLLVEAYDPATGEWVQIASKDTEGQHISSSDIATILLGETQTTGAAGLQLRVTNRTTGQIITMDSSQALVSVDADGTMTISIEDTAGGDNDFNDIVIKLENDSGAVTRRGLTSVQSLPALPYTPEQLEQIQKTGAELFFDKLSQAPAGSPAATLYNLYRARAISTLDEFSGKVDTATVNADINTYLADPAVQQLMAEAQSETAQSVLGVTSADAATAIQTTLLAPETIAALQQLSPEARQQYISNALTQMAFFDPALAKDTLKQLVAQMLTSGTPTEFLANASPEATEVAVQAVFQIAITQSRFGFGALGNAGTGLARLTEAQLGEAGTAYAEWLRTGADPANLERVMSNVGIGAESTIALRNFVTSVSKSGLLGSVSGVLAGIAVVQDFTGVGTMTTMTPWGIVNTTADVMSLVGAGEGFYNAGVTALNIGRAGYAALSGYAEALNLANTAAPGAVAEATQGIELTGLAEVDAAIISDALSSNASIAATLGSDGIETLSVGLAASSSGGSAVSIASALPASVTQAQIDEITELMANLTLSDVPAQNAVAIQAAIEASPELAASLGPEGVAAASESLAGTVNFGPLNLEQDLSGFTIGEITDAPLADAAVATLVAPETVAEVAATATAGADIAIAAETGAVAAGLSEAEAAAAGAIAGDVAVAGAEVGSASALTLSSVLKGLGVLGSVANFLYAAKSFAGAEAAFKEGDTTGGVLSLGSGLGFTVGGTAGVGSFLATMGVLGEASLFAGPAAPIVAAAAALVGAGLSIWNYFHQKHRHDEQIDQLGDFLQSGVGTGKSYLLP